jgi:hydroxypyruvate isomerase
MDFSHVNDRRNWTRRALLGTAGLSTIGAIGLSATAEATGRDDKRARAGRFKQSLAYWCVEKYWDIRKTCQVAKQLGCGSVELVPPADWPVLKEHGLVCALASSHPFERGMNNPKYQPACVEKIRSAVDACAEFGFPNVITFTGFREDIPDDAGLRNCVDAYKKIVGYAESRKITLCLEMLNSRVREEMKGHPGYQGDHTEYVMEIIRQVGSPRLKLLFDVYHVQIMDGDIIARIRQYKEFVGHYHVAGCPGRGELDDRQEINFKAVMKAIADTGYTGYVGQEFVPTRDPLQSLTQAVRLCDV